MNMAPNARMLMLQSTDYVRISCLHVFVLESCTRLNRVLLLYLLSPDQSLFWSFHSNPKEGYVLENLMLLREGPPGKLCKYVST